ncbi:MAG: PQQ-binding-like beta-propeller repeat protein [Candidatus Thiodiazotropha endolucinida]
MSPQVARLLSLLITLGLLVSPVLGAIHNSDQSRPQLVVSDNGVFLFDSNTLIKRWQRLTDQQTFAPALLDDRLLVSGSRGLYAIDLQQGDILWHLPGKHLGFPVVVYGDTAYLASRDGNLSAIDSSSGAHLWQVRFPGWVYPPAQAGDLLFTGGSDATLWAVDSRSGHIVWSRSLGQELVYSPAVLTDGQVVVTTFNREVLSFDRSGRLLWRHSYPAIMKTPVISGKQLIFSGLDPVLRAVDADNGRELWQRRLPEPLAVGLVSQQGMILAALESGRIWVLESATGALQQEYRLPGLSVAGPRIHKGEMLGFIHAFGGPKAVVATRLKLSDSK